MKKTWKILVALATAVAAIVGTTYTVIDRVIVAHYRLEISRLEKIIDQNEKIANQNEEIKKLIIVINNLRETLEAQTEIALKRQQDKNLPPSPSKTEVHSKRTGSLNRLISTGESLLVRDVTDAKTYDLFSDWRKECISLLALIDTELKRGFEANFTALTDIDRAGYSQLRTKISDGISVMKAIKLYY